MSRKRLLLISSGDPTNIQTFSGIASHVYQALTTHYDVDSQFIHKIPRWVRLYGSLMNVLFKSRHRLRNSIAYSWAVSKLMEKQVKRTNHQYNYILFLNCVQLLAYFDHSLYPNSKIIYYSDSTFQLGIDYYPATTNLIKFNLEEGFKIDKKAFQKADLILLSSEWAKSSLTNFYNIRPSIVRILEYGANIKDTQYRERSFSNEFRLLIVGVDWLRKGIDLAVEVHKQLLERGYRSQLTIIGLKKYPKSLSSIPNVRLHTFLRKDTPEGEKKIKEEFELANYFLFPTLADCTPIVLAEAMMFGLPIVARNTGGLSSMVENGQNGILIDKHGQADDFINGLMEIHKPDVYEKFAQNSRRLYETKFNWNHWLLAFQKHLKSMN